MPKSTILSDIKPRSCGLWTIVGILCCIDFEESTMLLGIHQGKDRSVSEPELMRLSNWLKSWFLIWLESPLHFRSGKSCIFLPLILVEQTLDSKTLWQELSDVWMRDRRYIARLKLSFVFASVLKIYPTGYERICHGGRIGIMWRSQVWTGTLRQMKWEALWALLIKRLQRVEISDGVAFITHRTTL
jgi:hypothetical protein